VDILESGALDYRDSLLERCELVIGSVHIGPDDPLRTPESAAAWCASRCWKRQGS